jgi:hypothetical protein
MTRNPELELTVQHELYCTSSLPLKKSFKFKEKKDLFLHHRLAESVSRGLK